jgi:hypothetical protein
MSRPGSRFVRLSQHALLVAIVPITPGVSGICPIPADIGSGRRRDRADGEDGAQRNTDPREWIIRQISQSWTSISKVPATASSSRDRSARQGPPLEGAALGLGRCKFGDIPKQIDTKNLGPAPIRS